MKKNQILFLDAQNEVVEADSWITIFPTHIIPDAVVDNLVNIWNKTDGEGCLGAGGTLDDYLLDEGRITTDQSEVVTESLARYLARPSLRLQSFEIKFMQTELHQKTVTVEAVDKAEALKKVRSNPPTEVDADEFFHPIETYGFEVSAPDYEGFVKHVLKAAKNGFRVEYLNDVAKKFKIPTQ